MISGYLFQFLPFAVLEFVAAFAAAVAVEHMLKQNADAAIGRLLASPLRFGWAAGFVIAPTLIGLFLNGAMTALYRSEHWASVAHLVSYFLSVVFGALTGLGATCCAASVDGSGRFRLGHVAAICAPLVLIPLLLVWLGRFRPEFSAIIHIFLDVTILAVARVIIGDRSVPPPEPGEPRVLVSPMRSLIIGFTPSALLLAAFGVVSALNLPKADSAVLLWCCSAVSVVCCFVASGMLFSRKTGGAILGGIMLMLLNAFIAFFFGCCASLNPWH